MHAADDVQATKKPALGAPKRVDEYVYSRSCSSIDLYADPFFARHHSVDTTAYDEALDDDLDFM